MSGELEKFDTFKKVTHHHDNWHSCSKKQKKDDKEKGYITYKCIDCGYKMKVSNVEKSDKCDVYFNTGECNKKCGLAHVRKKGKEKKKQEVTPQVYPEPPLPERKVQSAKLQSSLGSAGQSFLATLRMPPSFSVGAHDSPKTWVTAQKPRPRPTNLICRMTPGGILGSGGFSTVYKAVDHLGTLYAVKTMELGSSEMAKEYRALKLLCHRNIVKVWDFYDLGGHAEMVMTYWAQSIEAFVTEFSCLGTEVVRNYTKQLISGLEYIHTRGVRHLDIKPANILVNQGVVALTDFNLCNVVESTYRGHTKLYLHPLGVVNAPLVLRDIWALGCSVFFMALGIHPNESSACMAPYDTSAVSDQDLQSFGDKIFTDSYNDVKGLMTHDFVRDRTACNRTETRRLTSRPLSTVGSLICYDDGHLDSKVLELETILVTTSDYTRGIKPAGSEIFFSSSDKKKTSYPTQYRPARILLEMLGRSDNRKLVDCCVPNIILTEPLDKMSGSQVITINADAIQRLSGVGEAHPSPAEVYGHGKFSISVKELKDLARSTFIATSGNFTPEFFHEISNILNGKDPTGKNQIRLPGTNEELPQEVACRFWSLVIAIPLEKIGELNISAPIAELEGALKGRDEDTRTVYEEWFNGFKNDDEGTLEEFRVKAEVLAEHFTRWRNEVMGLAIAHGIHTPEDAKATFKQSLGELCNSVCISQQGYFLVEGCLQEKGYSYSQLAEKTETPVTFLFAAGVDFDRATVRLEELNKYFTREDRNKKRQFVHIGERKEGQRTLGEHSLKQRIAGIYKAVFECAKHHRVTCLSMTQLGMGVFLSSVPDEHKDAVKTLYLEAQFEMLFEKDWGFESYYLAMSAMTAKQLTDILTSVEEQQQRTLPCNVVFHSRDANYLAMELAKTGKRVGVLVPSDCRSLMWGIVGGQWEDGRFDLYAGEQDTAAHSTAILAHVNIRS